MIIQKLDWDTEFFGFKIGKVTIPEEGVFDWSAFKAEAKAENYNLIYVFKTQSVLPNDILLNAHLDLVDIQMTMSRKFEKEQYLDIEYEMRTELNPSEREQCYYIAEETAKVSRFYKEKNIGEAKTKELYRKWIDNALNKSFSDGIFLDKRSGDVSGLHIIKTDRENKTGYFTLTGVNPNYKRMGIGHYLWMQSFAYWAKEADIEIVKSPFSLQNKESLNFHLKRGFDKIEEIKYVYHYRNI